MAYVVTALWGAKEGEEEAVRTILETLAPLCRAEPGCRQFTIHRSTEDPRLFFLYEQYEDEAAFAAHAASEHVERHVRGDAVASLERRERSYYVTMD